MAKAQDSEEIEGIFFLINTVGGDCSCGLAVAEMIASIKKPTVSLIIGDSHSIGVPLSVAADRTFIAPTATMGPSSGTFKWNDNWCTPDF